MSVYRSQNYDKKNIYIQLMKNVKTNRNTNSFTKIIYQKKLNQKMYSLKFKEISCNCNFLWDIILWIHKVWYMYKGEPVKIRHEKEWNF